MRDVLNPFLPKVKNRIKKKECRQTGFISYQLHAVYDIHLGKITCNVIKTIETYKK